MNDFRADFVRHGGRNSASVPRLICASLISPGLTCIWLYRIEHALFQAGALRGSSIVRAINHAVTGADFVPGARLGAGLLINHPSGIVVGHGVTIGKNATILQGVTVGEANVTDLGDRRYPSIGDDVVIGANSSVLGDVMIGDGVRIGAHTLVMENVDSGQTVVGVPGRIVVNGISG